MLQVITLGATLADMAIASAVGPEAAPAVKGGLAAAGRLVSIRWRALFDGARHAPGRAAA